MSSKDLYPTANVTCREAQILASRVATHVGLENYTTSLMFGIQWDLVLTYLEKNGTEIYSKSLGNYYDNLWTISNTNAKYNTSAGGYPRNWKDGAYGTKTKSSYILLSTGADISFSKMNIYDMGGNVWEWTLEHGSSSYPCTVRGGDYFSGYGNSHRIHSRGGYPINYPHYNIGFRVTLY